MNHRVAVYVCLIYIHVFTQRNIYIFSKSILGFRGGIMPLSNRKTRGLLKLLGGEFTLNDFISKTQLSPSTAKRYLHELIRRGYVVESGGKYIVAEKGLLLLEGESVSSRSVGEEYSYVFTNENGVPIPLRVDSLEKLYIVLKYKLLPENILKYHLEKGYLQSWISSVLGGTLLAKKINETRSPSELLALLEEYLGVE